MAASTSRWRGGIATSLTGWSLSRKQIIPLGGRGHPHELFVKPDEAEDQEAGNNGKGDDQAYPDADTTKPKAEREPCTAGEPDQPIADGGIYHRGSRILQTAKTSHANDLAGIEHLKESGHHQQGRGKCGDSG